MLEKIIENKKNILVIFVISFLLVIFLSIFNFLNKSNDNSLFIYQNFFNTGQTFIDKETLILNKLNLENREKKIENKTDIKLIENKELDEYLIFGQDISQLPFKNGWELEYLKNKWIFNKFYNNDYKVSMLSLTGTFKQNEFNLTEKIDSELVKIYNSPIYQEGREFKEYKDLQSGKKKLNIYDFKNYYILSFTDTFQDGDIRKTLFFVGKNVYHNDDSDYYLIVKLLKEKISQIGIEPKLEIYKLQKDDTYIKDNYKEKPTYSTSIPMTALPPIEIIQDKQNKRDVISENIDDIIDP